MSMGSLAKHQPQANLAPDELTALARRAWIERGVAMVVIQDVADPWERQVVRNVVERQLGLKRG